jgi:hypothetical protein
MRNEPKAIPDSIVELKLSMHGSWQDLPRLTHEVRHSSEFLIEVWPCVGMDGPLTSILASVGLCCFCNAAVAMSHLSTVSPTTKVVFFSMW